MTPSLVSGKDWARRDPYNNLAMRRSLIFTPRRWTDDHLDYVIGRHPCTRPTSFVEDVLLARTIHQLYEES